LQSPGFSGHSKFFVGSRKFMAADGGMQRLVWMPKELKEEVGHFIEKRAKELGLEDFLNKIADETTATTEEEVLAYMQQVNHPALSMAPLI